MSEQIRTLGLYQPFATLMLHGKIETRMVACYWDPIKQARVDRKPPFPLGVYLLYSTKRFYHLNECAHIMGRFFRMADDITVRDPARHLHGYAIAIGELVEIIDPMEFHPATYVDLPVVEEDIHGYPVSRRVGLVFRNVKRIKPFKFKGKQGIGFLNAEDRYKIETV